MHYSRKTKYILVLVLFFIIFLESIFFSYFYFISNDRENLKNYSEKRNGSLSYKYFNEIGLVLPKPNKKTIHYTNEFLDTFETKDVFNNGMGFFDDGIDERSIKAVALGDSFTRGVGSLDNLKYGWVELVEKNFDKIDIFNLGGGIGINDQSYSYEKLKSLLDHNLVIYNFFSGGDYFDNLSDIFYPFYLKNNFDKHGKEKTQKIVNDLNIRHGYKHYLEYLNNNKVTSYTVYFFLKVADFLNAKGFVNTYKFKYKIPISEARTKKVSNELFDLYLNNKTEKNCGKKYCFVENKNFEDSKKKNMIIKNTSEKINNLFYKLQKEDKDFLLIIHPSARNLLPELTKVNYNTIDQKMISLLDKRIKILDLKKDLSNYQNINKNYKIFYKHDGHYTLAGYKLVSEIISAYLKKNF